jgi:hypothetical protein
MIHSFGQVTYNFDLLVVICRRRTIITNLMKNFANQLVVTNCEAKKCYNHQYTTTVRCNLDGRSIFSLEVPED